MSVSLAGDRSRLGVLWIVELRAALGPSRASAIVAALGIAVSVAMAAAVERVSRSVAATLERTASDRAGSAALEVRNGTLGVPEALVATVAGVPGVASAAPVVEATFRLVDGPVADAALHVLGLDLLAERVGVRVTSAGVAVADPLRLLARPESVIVGASLLERAGLREGGLLRVRAAGRERALVVRGVLAPGGVGDLWDGQLALMDVYALQMLVGREGLLDRIDVALAPEADADRVRDALSSRLGRAAAVRRPRRDLGELEAAMASMQIAASTFAVIAALVAALVAYGTMSLAVARRLREIACLRAAGLEASRAWRLVGTHCALVAVAGTLLGLPLAWVLSELGLDEFSRQYVFHERHGVTPLPPTAATLAVALAVGMGVSLLGGLGPALRVARVAPLDLLDSARPDPRGRRVGALPFALVATLALSVCGAAALPVALPAALRASAWIAAGLLVLAAATGRLLRAALRALAPVLERLAPSVGPLAGVSALARLGPVRIAVCSIAGIVTGVGCVFAVVHSYSEAIDSAFGAFGPGSIYVLGGVDLDAGPKERIGEETLARIRATPGVQAVAERVYDELSFREHEVGVLAERIAVLAERAPEFWRGSDRPALTAALVAGQVGASRAFAARFGVSVGDEIELPTRAGPRSFEIGGLFDDMSTDGLLLFDLATFDRHWPRSGAGRVAVWTSEPTEAVAGRIRAGADALQPLVLLHGEKLAKRGTDFVAPYLGLLRGVGALLCALGALSLLVTQLGAVLDRRRELGLLRAAGATRAQLVGAVLLDALVTSALAATVGVALGIACGRPSLGVLGETFHWSLAYTPDLAGSAGLAAASVAAALLAALVPALRAARVAPTEALTRE